MADDANPYEQFLKSPAPAAGGSDAAPQTIVERGFPMSSVGALPQPDQGEQAREARESVSAAVEARHQRKTTPEYSWMSMPPPPKPEVDPENPYEQFRQGPQDDGLALLERRRLNRQDAFYRSTVPGSARLAILANVYRTPDPPDLSKEMKAVRKQQREEYVQIVSDLAAHDQMKPWGTTMEAAAAFEGQLEGTMIDPASWVGWGAKGASFIARTFRAGGQQAGIQVATDPLVQKLNIESGVQDEYDPLRTAVSAATGFGIGAGGHAIGEGLGKIIGQNQLRRQIWELAGEDPAFGTAQIAKWAMDPSMGVPATRVEPPPVPTAAARAPAPELPPVPEGMVRVYHGGEGATDGGERHVSPSYEYARDYRAGDRPNSVWYVDVPADSPWLRQVDVSGTNMPPSYMNSIAPPEVAAGFRRVPEAAPKTAPVPESKQPKDYGLDDTVVDVQDRMPEAPPEQVKQAAYDEEVGTALRTAAEDLNIPPERLEEFQKLYKREEGESVDTAVNRAMDDWVEVETQKGLATATDDAVLRQQVESAESDAFRDTPPELWVAPDDVLEEARRLSRGWQARDPGRRPQSLTAFVRKNGGILKDSPEAADLLSQDIGRQPGLLRTKAGGGRSYDDMAQKAVEAGFDLGPDTGIGNGVNAARFMEMLVEDASKRQKHYPAGVDTEGHFSAQQYNDDTINFLKNRLGVNPKGMDPRQIAWLLLKGGEREERTGGRVPQEGGGVSGGRAAQPREGEGTAGGGAEPPTSGERGGERPAGGEAGATAEPAALGEKLGGPTETLGGKPKETFAEFNARLKKEREPAEALVRDALADPNTRLVLRKGDRALMVSRSTDEGVDFRVTSFDKDGPTSHRDYSEKGQGIYGPNGIVQEVHSALRDGYQVEARPLATERTAQGEHPTSRRGEIERLERRISDLDEEIQKKFGSDYVGYRLATDPVANRNRPELLDSRLMAAREELKRLKADEPLATEKTAQGEQTLMPGVEPVSDRARVEAQMAKSLRGGNAGMPEGGLFDEGARAQTDIFDLTPKIEQRARQTAGTKGVVPPEPEPIPASLGRFKTHDDLRSVTAAELRHFTERELDDFHFYIETGSLGTATETEKLYGAIQHELDVRGRGAAQDRVEGTGQDVSGRAMEPQGIAQRKKGGLMQDEPVRQAVPKEEAPSPEQEIAIRSLQQQTTDLAEAVGVPIREGRVTMRKAAGTFNPNTGVARIREFPDFDVAVHEIAHGIEAKVGVQLTTLTQQHSVEMRALDYDQTARGRRINEGFAEYVRLLVTNPEAARLRAPTFDVEFRSFMQQEHPDILSKLEKARQAYQAYNAASSMDAVGSVVRSVQEEPGRVERMAAALVKDELPNTVKSAISKVYDTMWDNKAPMTQFVREMGKAIKEREGALVDLKAADNPEILLRLSERSRQAATLNLQYGVRGYHETFAEGPSLVDAIAEALGEQSWWGKYNEGKRKDFSAYLVARRADYLWDKHNAGLLPNPPVAFSQADAKQAMIDLVAAHPNFANASNMVHQYTRQILKKAFDGGLLTPERYAKLLEEEFYVPFMRDMRDKPVIGTGMGQGAEGPGTTAIVRKMRGSARDIIDPLESIMGQTFLIERTLAHNDIIKTMANLAKRGGIEGGQYVEPVPPQQLKLMVADLEQAIANRAKVIGMDADEAKQLIAALGGLDGDAIKGNYFVMERTAANGEPIVFYREGGELKAVRVMSEKEGLPLYELLTAAPPVVTDIWANILTLAGSVKRSSIITNPTFMVSNYIRDQMAAALLRPDYVPFIGGARGIADEWRQANNAILYAYAGGVAGGRAVGVVDQAVERDINALARKGYSVTRVPNIHELKEFASFTEAGTRNSIFGTVYEQGLRKGLSSYEAMVEAAFQAQDLLDFSRHGSRTLWLRQFLPFFNAHLQGLDKARRVMIEPLFRERVFQRDTAEFNNALLTWGKAGAAGAALGVIYAAVMSESEAYKDASPMLKGTHLVVPFGNKLYLIPKPFELGLGFTMGEYGWHALAEKDPRAMRMLREAAWDVIKPPDPIADMPIVTPALELGLGKSWFTGRDIVPEALQRLPSEQQFTDRTSELGKYIGRTIGVSPIKVDYAVASVFATWGRDVMAMSQGVSENTPAASLDDAVFFRRWVKDPTRSSDVTTRFWQHMGQTTGKFNQDVAGYNDLVKDAVTRGAPMSAANDFLSKLPAAERAFVTLKSGARENGKPAFTADERRLHPLQHAYDAVEMLNGLRKELGTNAQMTFGGREKIVLNPVQRRDLLENVRELAQMEMRNGLAIMGEAGFAGRPILDPNDTMAKIRAISPAVADEIATRYATAKIFSTESIRRSWPQLRDQLVRNGTEADIRGLSFDAKAEGYQFGGNRAKRPGITRLPIAGAPTP